MGRVPEASALLLGTTGAGPGVNSTLVELDPATGALVRTIGSVGYTVNGLEYDHTTGKLYGSTSKHDPLFNGLIELSMATGAGTPVGNPGWGLSQSSEAVNNITVDSTGQMYGWWEPDEDDLVSIDKMSGIATRVGDSGLSDTYLHGLAFDTADTLWIFNGTGDYHTVDPSTGAAAPSSGSLPYPDILWAHHGDFDPVTGHYYGIDDLDSTTRSLVVADLAGDSSFSTMPTIDCLHTLTFVAPVPEPATMLLLGAGLVGLAGLRRRMKKGGR